MIKWIKLKKKISDNPSMIDPYRIMNYRAAKKTWKEQGRLSTWELMEGARIKAAKTPSEWEALTGIKREYKGETSSATRRWAIALIIIILFSSFMAFTVPGRALAKKLYDVFTTFVGNMLYVSYSSDLDKILEAPEKEFDNNTIHVYSIEEAYDYVKQPIHYLADERYTFICITISESKAKGELVSIDYEFNDMQINLRQRWIPEASLLETSLSLDNGQYLETITDSDVHFYGSYTEGDCSYLGIALLDNSTLYVGIEHVNDTKLISSILNDITYYAQ